VPDSDLSSDFACLVAYSNLSSDFGCLNPISVLNPLFPCLVPNSVLNTDFASFVPNSDLSTGFTCLVANSLLSQVFGCSTADFHLKNCVSSSEKVRLSQNPPGFANHCVALLQLPGIPPKPVYHCMDMVLIAIHPANNHHIIYWQGR
jgi:hypothetical protein